MTSRAAAGVLVLANLATFALTTSIAHSLLHLSNGHNVNLTFSPNVTSSKLFNSDLPPDPFFYDIQDTDLVVKFSNFRGPLQRSAAERVIQAALLDCSTERPNARMPMRQRRYTEENFHRADLVVQPGGIKWAEWKLVLAAMEVVVSAWDCVDMEFSVLDESATPRSICDGHLEPTADIAGKSAMQ